MTGAAPPDDGFVVDESDPRNIRAGEVADAVYTASAASPGGVKLTSPPGKTYRITQAERLDPDLHRTQAPLLPTPNGLALSRHRFRPSPDGDGVYDTWAEDYISNALWNRYMRERRSDKYDHDFELGAREETDGDYKVTWQEAVCSLCGEQRRVTWNVAMARLNKGWCIEPSAYTESLASLAGGEAGAAHPALSWWDRLHVYMGRVR